MTVCNLFRVRSAASTLGGSNEGRGDVGLPLWLIEIPPPVIQPEAVVLEV